MAYFCPFLHDSGSQLSNDFLLEIKVIATKENFFDFYAFDTCKVQVVGQLIP